MLQDTDKQGKRPKVSSIYPDNRKRKSYQAPGSGLVLSTIPSNSLPIISE